MNDKFVFSVYKLIKKRSYSYFLAHFKHENNYNFVRKKHRKFANLYQRIAYDEMVLKCMFAIWTSTVSYESRTSLPGAQFGVQWSPLRLFRAVFRLVMLILFSLQALKLQDVHLVGSRVRLVKSLSWFMLYKRYSPSPSYCLFHSKLAVL